MLALPVYDPPRVTFSPEDPREPYWVNCQYGFSTAVRAYARYPHGVNAILPHGVMWDPRQGAIEAASSPVPAVLSYPALRDDTWGDLTVIPSASPFLYALSMVNPIGERSGTVFFPQHSCDLIHEETDWWELGESILRLPKEIRPKTVCLYWKDVLLGRARCFDRVKVVTCGHLNDPMFMPRLLDLLLSHEHAASNDVLSTTFYAAAAGCNFFIHGPASKPVFRDGCPNDLRVEHDPRQDEVKRLFSEPRPLDDDQRECAAYHLGAERFKSPADLLADLEYAESLRSARC